MISFKRAIKIAYDKEGYIPCTRPDHGYGELCTYDGKTAIALLVMCPTVQFYPKPSYLFHSKLDFRRSCDDMFRKRGWIK